MADKKVEKYVEELKKATTLPELKAVVDKAKKDDVALHPGLIAAAVDRIVDKR
jgi:hypothetical protein